MIETITLKAFAEVSKMPLNELESTLLKWSNANGGKIMHRIDGAICVYRKFFELWEEINNSFESDMVPAWEIIQKATDMIPIKRAAYVYFLIDKGKIVYVGKSQTLPMRISTHLDHNEKVFDKVFCIEVDVNRLEAIESLYIADIVPKYNKTFMDRVLYFGYVCSLINSEDVFS